MTTTDGERPQERRLSTTTIDYEGLLAVAKAETEPVPAADYEQLAESIAASRKYALGKQMSMAEADHELMDAYVHDAVDPRLARFAETAIKLPRMSAYQAKIRRNPPSEISKQLAYALCEFNHDIRDTILDVRQSMDRQQSVKLLNDASDNRAMQFLPTVISGATAEIAIFDALSLNPDFSDTQYTGIKDDLDGVDITSRHFGKLVGIDGKYDNSRKEGMRYFLYHGERIPLLKVSVPDEFVDNFTISPVGAEKINNKLSTFMAGIQRYWMMTVINYIQAD
jgi:hypothetical protein